MSYWKQTGQGRGKREWLGLAPVARVGSTMILCDETARPRLARWGGMRRQVIYELRAGYCHAALAITFYSDTYIYKPKGSSL